MDTVTRFHDRILGWRYAIGAWAVFWPVGYIRAA